MPLFFPGLVADGGVIFSSISSVDYLQWYTKFNQGSNASYSKVRPLAAELKDDALSTAYLRAKRRIEVILENEGGKKESSMYEVSASSQPIKVLKRYLNTRRK